MGISKRKLKGLLKEDKVRNIIREEIKKSSF